MSEIVQELDNQLKIIMHWLNRFLTHVSNIRQGLLGAAVTSASFRPAERQVLGRDTMYNTEGDTAFNTDAGRNT